MRNKTYFQFKFFGREIFFKKEFSYRDRYTGKCHYKRVFKIRGKGDYEKEIPTDWFEVFIGGKCPPSLRYKTCGYNDNHHWLDFSLFFFSCFIKMPWKNHKKGLEFGEDVNNTEPEYGFYMYGEDSYSGDTLTFLLGSKRKSFEMPWILDFHAKYALGQDRRLFRLDKNESLYDDNPKILFETHRFRYKRADGLQQETDAKCTIVRREWRRKWLKFTSMFGFSKQCLDITFKEPLGNSRGDWKGGAVGRDADITETEVRNGNIITPLRRYEKKVNETKEFD